MGFLSPWFLLGLAAIGLPIYIHLLRRHVTTPLPFSSLMFFERGTQSSTRHRRLRYLLLFSLRAALLLLLVLAFANPFIRRASAGVNDKLLLVVVDDSFSMKAGSRFADAKQGGIAGAGIAATIPARRSHGSGWAAGSVDPACSRCGGAALRGGEHPAHRLARQHGRAGPRSTRPGRDGAHPG